MATLRITLLIVGFFNFLLLGNAYPTTGNHTELQKRQCVYNGKDYDCNQYLPTAAQLVARMRDTSWYYATKPESVTWFYTNLGSKTEMRDLKTRTQLLQFCITWLLGRGIKIDDLVFYNIAVETEWYNQQAAAIDNPKWEAEFKQQYGTIENAKNVFFDCTSQAMALATLNPEVILFTRLAPYFQPDPSSAWEQSELWPLTRPGGLTQRIWRVDPRPYPYINADLPVGAPQLTTCPEPELIWLRGRDPPTPQKRKCWATHDDGSVPGLLDPYTEQFPQSPAPAVPPTQPFQLPIPAVAPVPMPPAPAAPPPPGNQPALQRRQCSYDGSRWVCNQHLPTLGQWVARMRNPNLVTGTRPETVTWFYSNLASQADMQDVGERARLWALCIHWITARGLGHTFYGNSVNPQWLGEQDKVLTGSTWAAELTAQFGSVQLAKNAYNDCQSQAIALAALSPEVIFFTRGSGHQPLDDSVWNLAEFWPMTRAGGQVRAILRVDPSKLYAQLTGGLC